MQIIINNEQNSIKIKIDPEMKLERIILNRESKKNIKRMTKSITINVLRIDKLLFSLKSMLGMVRSRKMTIKKVLNTPYP
jgi:hypothetical protein